MSFLVIAAILTFAAVLYTLFIRAQDLPESAPASPVQHLEGRKAAIYENLRDLNFEYRVGKLSDTDYQRTKKDMQAELAVVLAEIDRIQQQKPQAAATAAPAPAVAADAAKICPHCGAKFDKPLKFCGECGKAMVA